MVPELAAEMATWEKRPGPFVLTDTGKPFTRKYFNEQFQEAIKAIPELQGCTMHGLRATAVIRLKRGGLKEGMIADAVGMSVEMVAYYCRFENKRESGKTALVLLAEHAERKNAKATS